MSNVSRNLFRNYICLQNFSHCLTSSWKGVTLTNVSGNLTRFPRHQSKSFMAQTSCRRSCGQMFHCALFKNLLRRSYSKCCGKKSWSLLVFKRLLPTILVIVIYLVIKPLAIYPPCLYFRFPFLVNLHNRSFARWRYLTTKPRMLGQNAFLFKFVFSLRSKDTIRKIFLTI